MTTFLLLSDTHFGFSQSTRRIWSKYWDQRIATAPEFERLDCLLLAGDIMSHETRQLKGAFKFFRQKMGDKPIAWVRGNHDYWDSSLRNLDYLIQKTSGWAKEFDIYELHNGAMWFEDEETDSKVLLLGWDTWYTSHPGRYTQDLLRIPWGLADGHEHLYRRAANGFYEMLGWYDHGAETAKSVGSDLKGIVTVTHMPGGYTDRHIGQPQTWWDMAINASDVLCYGHTHRRDDRVIDNCRIINAGSDYNKPNHVFFEL